MNDQSSFVLSFEHLRNDLIERNDLGLDSGSKQLQREIRGRQRAGYGNALGLDFAVVNGRGETTIGP